MPSAIAIDTTVIGSGWSASITGTVGDEGRTLTAAAQDLASASMQQLSQAAGYKAMITCSAVFVAGRPLEEIYSYEFSGLSDEDALALELPDPEIDRRSRSVAVAYSPQMPPRRSAFRQGMGCTQMPPGTTTKDIPTLPYVDMPMPPGDPAHIAWPDGDVVAAGPLPATVDAEALTRAVESAFTRAKYRPHKTIAVVVVYKERIIAERYAPGWDLHTQYRSWSSAKSIAATLVGIMIKEGKLRAEDAAPIPEWQSPGDARKRITIANLLHMSSGLQKDCETGGGCDSMAAYFRGANTLQVITDDELAHEPGTHWDYANRDTLLLVRAIKQVIDDEQAYLTFPRRALLNKIGMRDTLPEVDAYGNFLLSSQVYTTARDLARLGLLYLHDGVWKGERILPEGWTDYVAQPAPAKTLDEGWGYGAQFWLLGRDPRVPEHTYTTAGARGQLSTIVPSRDLVVARTGVDPSGGNWDQIELVADVIAAISE